VILDPSNKNLNNVIDSLNSVNAHKDSLILSQQEILDSYNSKNFDKWHYEPFDTTKFSKWHYEGKDAKNKWHLQQD